MANQISDEKMAKALDLIYDGKSVREIAKGAGIAKETAHRLQKVSHFCDIDAGRTVSVKLNGTASISTREMQPHWYNEIEPISKRRVVCIGVERGCDYAKCPHHYEHNVYKDEGLCSTYTYCEDMDMSVRCISVNRAKREVNNEQID